MQRIGRLTLNRNPDNFFAETEQVAFHPGHIVPGIDFSNDPLLQGRLFSYTDTQLSRLGGPNFHQIPINQSVSPVHNHQRDAHMQMRVDKGRVAYEPNSLGGGCPFQAGADLGGFVSFAERIDAQKIRGRSKSFFDHFSQAALFFNSQAPHERSLRYNGACTGSTASTTSPRSRVRRRKISTSTPASSACGWSSAASTRTIPPPTISSTPTPTAIRDPISRSFRGRRWRRRGRDTASRWRSGSRCRRAASTTGDSGCSATARSQDRS